MATALHSIGAERNQSQEYAVSQEAQRDAAAMAIYVKDYHSDIIASLRAAMANPLNEAHLSGGEHGDPSNAIGDSARNELAAKSGGSSMASYEASIVEKQSVDSKYLLTPTIGDAFQASEEAQRFAQEMQGWMALEAHTSGSELMAATAAEPTFAGKAPALNDMGAPDGHTQETQKAAEEGILGAANPITGQKSQNGSLMDGIKEKVQASGAVGALREAGVSMGKPSLFGDGGKAMGASMATPGQQEFQAAKQQEQPDLLRK